MKKNTLSNFFASLTFFMTLVVNAQHIKVNTLIQDGTIPNHRNCGLEKHEQELLKNPDYAKSFYERQAVFQQKIKEIHQKKRNGTYQNMSTLYIPVAVHFPEGNESDRVCLEALAQTQIDVINEDFTGTNPDQTLWAGASGFYPGLNPGNVNVKFCIATLNHPAGGDPEVINGNALVTIGANGSGFGPSDVDATYSGYMNFVIKNIGAGLLGYSPLAGNVSGGASVVMNTFCYGTGAGCTGYTPSAPYNLGRTVTHELGHFYNLNHTFIAASGGSCASPDGDGIVDTPKVANSTGGSPANGSVAGCVAGESSLTMNFMDYVNDASMYMFTPNQATRVDAYFATVASDWKAGVLDCQSPTFIITSDDLGNCGADTVTTNINYVTVNGFSQNTMFTISGLPAGATASFAPTSLNADGNTILTVTGLNTVTDAVYPLVITATAISEIKTLNINLNDIIANCAGDATTPWKTSITRVIFNTIDNASSLTGADGDINGNETGGYADNTAISTNVNIDSSYDLTVQVNTDGTYRTQTKVWIDWNQNCTFDIPSEEYDLDFAANVTDGATSMSPMSITIPATAVVGVTTMRVATIYSSPTLPYDFPNACGTNTDGEVEDYTINVLTSLSVKDNDFSNFNVYPNPTNGNINITLSSNKDVQVTLFDIRGRKVYAKLHTNNTAVFKKTLNFSNVEPGVYMLSVASEGKKATKKLVIQ